MFSVRHSKCVLFLAENTNREMRVEFFEIVDCISSVSEIADVVPNIVFIAVFFPFYEILKPIFY